MSQISKLASLFSHLVPGFSESSITILPSCARILRICCHYSPISCQDSPNPLSLFSNLVPEFYKSLSLFSNLVSLFSNLVSGFSESFVTILQSHGTILQSHVRILRICCPYSPISCTHPCYCKQLSYVEVGYSLYCTVYIDTILPARIVILFRWADYLWLYGNSCGAEALSHIMQLWDSIPYTCTIMIHTYLAYVLLPALPPWALSRRRAF